MTELKTEVIHKHFEMGQAPYRLTGIWSAPSRGILEANPSAYNSMMEERPSYCRMVCDHCGTGIIHHFVLRDAKGKKFSVGSSCIDKLGQEELVTQAQKLERERQRKLRQERAEKRREEREAKYQAELDAQREKNGGKTDHELKVEERAEREDALEDKYFELSEPIVKLLKKAGGDFCKSISRDLRGGRTPSGNGKTIVIEIMAKQDSGARKNSKQYKESLPKMQELFESVENEFKTLKAEHQQFLEKSFGFCN